MKCIDCTHWTRALNHNIKLQWNARVLYETNILKLFILFSYYIIYIKTFVLICIQLLKKKFGYRVCIHRIWQNIIDTSKYGMCMSNSTDDRTWNLYWTHCQYRMYIIVQSTPSSSRFYNLYISSSCYVTNVSSYECCNEQLSPHTTYRCKSSFAFYVSMYSFRTSQAILETHETYGSWIVESWFRLWYFRVDSVGNRATGCNRSRFTGFDFWPPCRVASRPPRSNIYQARLGYQNWNYGIRLATVINGPPVSCPCKLPGNSPNGDLLCASRDFVCFQVCCTRGLCNR